MDSNLTWVQYPQELINHAILHALRKKEFDLKMSIVLIDNAVEIIMKEYLSQPSTCFCTCGPTYREVKECLNPMGNPPALPGDLKSLTYAGVEESLSIRGQLKVSYGEAFDEVCIKSMPYDVGASITSCGYRSVVGKCYLVKFVDAWAKCFTFLRDNVKAAFWKGICVKIMCTCTSPFHPSMQLPRLSGS